MTSLPVTDFDVVKDDKTGSYDAIVGDREVGALTYDVAGEHGWFCWPPRCSPSSVTRASRPN